MKPLFFKELRQHLKWAIAVLAAMSIAAVYFGWLLARPDTSMRFYGFAWYGWQSTPFDHLQVLSVIGCPLAGLLLGVLHIAAEKRRDLWAFLVHRPHSRTTIFFAKTAAGLLLYFVAVGLPLAALTGWVAAPGRVAAPFYWPMMLPGVADVLTGAVYYLVGLLVSMREARWYGSRVLAIAVAIVCSVCVAAVPYFWAALIAILVAAGILGLAAWGSFLSGGHYTPQPRWARAALGVSLLTGIALVLAFGSTILAATRGIQPRRWPVYQLTKAGEVLLVVRDRRGQLVEITDLAGERREEIEQKAQEPGYWYDFFLQTVGVLVPQERDRGKLYGSEGYRQARGFYQPVAGRGVLETIWVYSFREQLFLAFDFDRRVLLGRLGPDGFVAAPGRPARQFRADVVALNHQSGLLAFDDVVYKLKARTRALERLYATTGGERVLTISDMRPWEQAALVVVTDRAVRFISPEGGDLVAMKLEHDLVEYGFLEFALTDELQRFYVWYKPSYWLGARAFEMPSQLIAYGPEGTAQTRQELPPNPPWRDVSTWRDTVVGLTVPLVFVVTAFVITRVQPTGWPFGAEGGAQMIVLLVLVGLVAVACAVTTIVLARRYAWGRGQRWGWGVFNFLVGPAGLLLLWGLHDWPSRLPCPACGKKRIVDRAQCEHCQAAFPPPATDGTEIFE